MNILGAILLFSLPSGGELILILLVVLLFFGAKRLPDLARGMGRAIREFKDATKEIKNEIEEGGKAIK
jgi:sec-independent protein translocase protein TatA